MSFDGLCRTTWPRRTDSAPAGPSTSRENSEDVQSFQVLRGRYFACYAARDFIQGIIASNLEALKPVPCVAHLNTAKLEGCDSGPKNAPQILRTRLQQIFRQCLSLSERPETQEVMAHGMYEACAALIPELVDLRYVPFGNLLHVIERSRRLFIEIQGSLHVSMLTPRLPERRLTILRRLKLIAIQVPRFEAFHYLNGPQDLRDFYGKVKASSGQSNSQVSSLQVTAKFQNISM